MECAVFYGKMFYVVTGFKVPEINRNHGMESDVLYIPKGSEISQGSGTESKPFRRSSGKSIM